MEIFEIFFSYLQDAPLVVWVIWILVFVFISFIILQILILKILRFRLRKIEIYNKNQQVFYEELLVYYLIESYDFSQINGAQKEIITKIKKSLKTSKNRKIFVETLIKIKGEISGETNESIDRLFEILGLSKRAYAKLKNKSWHIIALGIRDLRVFNVKNAKDHINKYINHPNTEIRRQVFLYFTSVFGFEGLDFLDNLKGYITNWSQIRILESLKSIKFQEIPNPKKWLESDNDSVVLFALELVRTYNLLDNLDTLNKLLNHKNNKIRTKTISIFTDFYYVDAKPALIDGFDNRTKEEQIEIFKFLELFATPEDEFFICQHVKHPIFEIKILAYKILNNINPAKFLEISDNENDENSTKIIQYILKV